VHSVLVTAALFLLGGAIAVQRGGDGFERSVPVAQPALLGGLFVIGAASVASLPPLSGFAGKLTILQATSTSPAMPLLWSVLLGSGLLAMIGLARAGSALFWRTTGDHPPVARPSLILLAPTVALLACGTALAVFASPILRFTEAAAEQLADRRAYATTVIGEVDRPTVRPFPGERRP
jgi:multicomponent K+:H+ antiporter subunit D